MLLNDLITIVAINKGITPDNQRREQLALFQDIFFKLLEFIIGQWRNLGLELRVDFQIDHTHYLRMGFCCKCSYIYLSAFQVFLPHHLQ